MKALAPVYTTIQRDSKTKGFVQTIRALKRTTTARPLTVGRLRHEGTLTRRRNGER
jgi:hypothetical protein